MDAIINFLKQIVFIFVIVVSMGLFVYALIVIRRAGIEQDKVNKEKESKARIFEHERAYKKTPQYKLSQNPSHYDLKQILANTSDMTTKRKAAQLALESDSIATIGLAKECFPELENEVFRRSMQLLFRQADPAKAVEYLSQFNGWDTLPKWREWWLSQKPILEKKASIYHEEQAEKERNKILEVKLRQAEANGKDVCWGCMTIEPDRCGYCNKCIDGCYNSNGTYCNACQSINYCGDPYCGGYCPICDDD